MNKAPSRRKFLKQSSMIAAGTLLAPYFINGMSGLPGNYEGKRLVIIQLSGGNDGLNTVVPFRNDLYYKARPRLAIQPNEVLKLKDDLGLHPAMTGLRHLYDEGLLTVINNVGYPNPDRSHFRSMDIWQTASGAEETWKTGWLGRYLDASCHQCESPHRAIEVNDHLSLAMKGEATKGMAMTNPKRLIRHINKTYARQLAALNAEVAEEEHNLGYLYKTLVETVNSADYISEHFERSQSTTTYPRNKFANSLKTIARLIGSGMETSVYYADLGGFDTHVGQSGKQARLLGVYSDAIKAFITDLKARGELEHTVVMTFSEFGRRVRQNASGGTDHGTANNLFIMGGTARPGFYNGQPNLADLDNGDLKYEIDFRRIYASLLDNWLGASSRDILKKEFKPLPFL